eukprot:scaffold155_cov347-Pavlova_lutheri.AAC.98
MDPGSKFGSTGSKGGPTRRPPRDEGGLSPWVGFDPPSRGTSGSLPDPWTAKYHGLLNHGERGTVGRGPCRDRSGRAWTEGSPSMEVDRPCRVASLRDTPTRHTGTMAQAKGRMRLDNKRKVLPGDGTERRRGMGGAKATRFQRNGGILYLKEVFDRDCFERTILPETDRIARSKLRPERSSKAKGRVGCYIPSTSPLHRLLHGHNLTERLQDILGEPDLQPSDYPSEYRLYTIGSAMEWHRDECMYTEPQIECVYTISNTSDSRTEWIDTEGNLHSQWTEPNSLLLIKAEGAEHRVGMVRRGERSILKFVYCTSLERTPAYDENLLQAYI